MVEPCICVSSYTTSGCCDWVTYVDRYSWLMQSKDTSAGVETQDVVACFLGMSKDLGVGDILGGLLGPFNSHNTL